MSAPPGSGNPRDVVSFWQAIGYLGAMQTRSIEALLLLAGPLLVAPAAAQPAPNQRVVVIEQAGLAQAAVASCAGGAMIGYLAVLATGAVDATGHGGVVLRPVGGGHRRQRHRGMDLGHGDFVYPLIRQ